MARMTGPDCAVTCNLINTHTHTQPHKSCRRHVGKRGRGDLAMAWVQRERTSRQERVGSKTANPDNLENIHSNEAGGGAQGTQGLRYSGLK